MAIRSMGSYSRRTYSTAAARTPRARAPSATRQAPHRTIPATAVLATSREPTTYRAISSRASPLERSWVRFSSANSASLASSRRKARTGRMPLTVSVNLTMTRAIAVDRRAYTRPTRRW